MEKKAKIDKDSCIGCGACTGICPNVFTIGDDGKATIANQVTSEDESAAEEAKDSCPVGAITIE